MTNASPCSASDIARLIGTPWEAGATGPETYDCWAFADMTQQRFFGRALPGLRASRRDTIFRTRRAWRRATAPVEGDLVEMRRMGRADHVGVWIAGGVLHCQRGAGAVFDRPDAIRAMGWQMRFWTPGAPEEGAAGDARVAALYVPGLDFWLGDADPDALIAAHRAVPIAARAGESVARILERAGLRGERIAVFLRDRGAGLSLPDAPEPGAVEALLQDLGALRPDAWETAVPGAHQTLVITRIPQGGGGSDPLQIVLQIAVLAAATALAGPLGPSVGAAFGVSGTIGQGLVFGAVNLIGGFVVSQLLPPPSPPALSGFAEQGSPTFSARPQASVARPGAPIPIAFGRHIHQLDDVSPPFARFEQNAQIIYQLLALGVGEYELNEVRLGDITVWRDGALTGNLPGVSIQHVATGEIVTLMEDAVWTQRDVSGLALEPDTVVGWHGAIPAGLSVDALEIDIAFQQLVRVANDGTNQTATVDILVEAQMIDDDDQPLGAVLTLDTLSFSDATRAARRSSHKWFLPQGRYRVRLTRQTPAGDDQTFDDAVWAGLKGIPPGGRAVDGVELLAVRVEVGEEFAAQSARQVRAIKTRKLPVWNGTSWSAPQTTRSIAWAAAEIARLHDRLDDLDLDALLELHLLWAGRGDRFDTVFDQPITFWEALQAVLRAGRAQPDQLGRRIRIWRDAPQPIPRQLFSERNIRRGSLSIRPRLAVSERPERLVAQFMNARTWRPDEIAVGTFTGRERRERYFGITGRGHLLREVGHDFRAARYRSVGVSFEAELENRLLLRGDAIALSHAELTAGVSCAIEAWAGLDIELDRSMQEVPGTALVTLTAPDGAVIGPFEVTPDPAPFSAVRVTQAEMDRIIADYGTDPRDWIARSAARDEPIRAILGPSVDLDMRLIVEEVGEERDGFARVTCVDDDPRAHSLEVDAAGTLDGVVTGVDVFDDAGTPLQIFINVFVDLSKIPEDPTVTRTHIFEISTDGGQTWTPFAETGPPTAFGDWPAGLTHVRAAIRLGNLRGPWVARSVATAALAAPSGLGEVVAGRYASQARLHVAAAAVSGASSYRFELREPGGGILAILFRATPDLDLDKAALEAEGALRRALRVVMAATDGSGGIGAAASLDLPVAPLPGKAVDFVLTVGGGILSWSLQGPAPVVGWRVAWSGGSKIVTVPEHRRSASGLADELRIAGLDHFGAGEEVTVDMTPEGRPPAAGG